MECLAARLETLVRFIIFLVRAATQRRGGVLRFLYLSVQRLRACYRSESPTYPQSKAPMIGINLVRAHPHCITLLSPPQRVHKARSSRRRQNFSTKSITNSIINHQ